MTNIEEFTKKYNDLFSDKYDSDATVELDKMRIDFFWKEFQKEQTRIAEEVKKKKGYWQVRFEGVSDGQERMHNKHYNEHFSDIKDEVIDIILSIIKQEK